MANTTERATFAAGCFWGVEHLFRKHFSDRIVHVHVGYAAGTLESPSYEQVKSGTTEHAEVIDLEFDPGKVGYGELVEYFFRIHDPTELNRQGPVVGPQYRSLILTHTPLQTQVAQKILDEIQRTRYPEKQIVTGILTLKTTAEEVEGEEGGWDGKVWTAEEYHQEYVAKNEESYYKRHGGVVCHYPRW
ncbi:Peptide methionine sulfoxide reductase [Rhizina undulata]